MERRAPLKTRKPLERKGQLRRTRFKPKPRSPRTDLHEAAAWQTAVLKDEKGRRRSCVRCGRLSSGMQGHHVVPKSFLKREYGNRPEIVWDPRVGIPTCERCHEKHTLRVDVIPADLIPAEAWEFARELGEAAVVRLEKEHPCRPASR